MRAVCLFLLGAIAFAAAGCSEASSAGGEKPLTGNRIPKGAGPAKTP